jgi:predicted GNAT family N-acyltransferase
MSRPGFTLRFIAPGLDDFDAVHDLCYAVLQEPFGVVRDDDWNDEDPASQHLVALSEESEPIGYARLIWAGTSAQIRQVTVAFARQRTGVGSALVRALVSEALEHGAQEIWLNARMSAIGFYEQLGFVALGEVFATGRTGLPHRRMEYRGFGA